MSVGVVNNSTTNNNAAGVASGSTADSTRTTGSGTLDVDDFLSLITVQLQNQDPLKPMEDTQFISQMASFTSLQQMQTLSKDFSTFTGDQESAGAMNYLGKYVTATTGSGASAATVKGTVTAVNYDAAGTPTLTIDGKTYDSLYLTSISNTAPAPANNP